MTSEPYFVDPERLAAKGRPYDDLARDWDKLHGTLSEIRARYNGVWGNDDLGNSFGPFFTQGMDDVGERIRGVGQTLAYYGDGLKDSSKIFVAAREHAEDTSDGFKRESEIAGEGLRKLLPTTRGAVADPFDGTEELRPRLRGVERLASPGTPVDLGEGRHSLLAGTANPGLTPRIAERRPLSGAQEDEFPIDTTGVVTPLEPAIEGRRPLLPAERVEARHLLLPARTVEGQALPVEPVVGTEARHVLLPAETAEARHVLLPAETAEARHVLLPAETVEGRTLPAEPVLPAETVEGRHLLLPGETVAGEPVVHYKSARRLEDPE